MNELELCRSPMLGVAYFYWRFIYWRPFTMSSKKANTFKLSKYLYLRHLFEFRLGQIFQFLDLIKNAQIMMTRKCIMLLFVTTKKYYCV